MDIINHKKDINELKYANKELIIKKEVNKYYEINKYNSFKDFFHDWSRKGNNYLTINFFYEFAHFQCLQIFIFIPFYIFSESI